MNKPDSKNVLDIQKEKPLHYPGQSLDKEINRLTLETWGYVGIFVFLAYLAVWEWLAWYFNIPRQPVLYTIYFIIGVPICVIMIFKNGNRIQNYRLGSKGEKIVGEELIELQKAGCEVLHDVVGGKFNIDHVVISPTGIYVIETKMRSRRIVKQRNESSRSSNYGVIFDGKQVILKGHKPDSEPVQQALRNADSIRKFLLQSIGKEYAVTAVLVYPDWVVKESTNDEKIWVLNPKYLKWRIPQQSNKLTSDEMQLISRQLAWFVRGKTD